MKGIVQIFPPDFERKPEDFNHPLTFLKHENKKEIYHLFKERLKDYDRYIEIRNTVRKKRYETQTIIPKKGKDNME